MTALLSLLLAQYAFAAQPPEPLVKGATHYETLGLTEKASHYAIKTRFRNLAKKYAADLHRGISQQQREQLEASMKILNEAYGVLNDPAARATYDWKLPGGGDPLQSERAPSEPVRRNTYYDFWNGPPNVFLGTKKMERLRIGKSYYETIGLSESASEAEIRQALRRQNERLDWSNFIAEDGVSCTLDEASFGNVIAAQRYLGFIRDALLKPEARRKYDTWLHKKGGFPSFYYQQPYESTMDPDGVAKSYRFIPRDIRAMVRFLNSAPKNTTIIMDSAREPYDPLNYMALVNDAGQVEISTKVWGPSTLTEKNGRPWYGEFELDRGALRVDQRTREKPFFLGKRLFDRLLLIWSFGFWPGEDASIDQHGYLHLGPSSAKIEESDPGTKSKSKTKAQTHHVPYVLSQEEHIDDMAALMSAFGFGGAGEVSFGGEKNERYHLTMGIPPQAGSGAATSSDVQDTQAHVVITKDIAGDVFGKQYFHLRRLRGGLKLTHEELVLSYKLEHPKAEEPVKEIRVDRKYLVGHRGVTKLVGENITASDGRKADIDGFWVANWWGYDRDKVGGAEAWQLLEARFGQAAAEAAGWRKERDLPPLKERIKTSYQNLLATVSAGKTVLKEIGTKASKWRGRAKNMRSGPSPGPK